VVERREINWRRLHRQLLVCVRSREANRQPVSSMTLAATAQEEAAPLRGTRFQIQSVRSRVSSADATVGNRFLGEPSRAPPWDFALSSRHRSLRFAAPTESSRRPKSARPQDIELVLPRRQHRTSGLRPQHLLLAAQCRVPLQARPVPR
jgi:hypothetical protein